MIDSRYLDLDFYKKSMSMFLRNSYGIEERCEMYYNILENVNDMADKLFTYLDFFYYKTPTDNYFTRIHEIEPTYPADGSGTTNKFLTDYASFFGVKRILPLNGVQVTLTDRELLIYLEASLVRASFNGTGMSLLESYTGSSILNFKKYANIEGLDSKQRACLNSYYKPSFLSELGIIYRTDTTVPLLCHIYINETAVGDSQHRNNLWYLFTQGLLTVQSVGILYNYYGATTFRFGHYNTSGVLYNSNVIYS